VFFTKLVAKSTQNPKTCPCAGGDQRNLRLKNFAEGVPKLATNNQRLIDCFLTLDSKRNFSKIKAEKLYPPFIRLRRTGGLEKPLKNRPLWGKVIKENSR
jgi:hypothetical protein